MPREFTKELVAWVWRAGLAGLGPESLDQARLLCMDLLGVMARGSREPAARLAGRVLLAQGNQPQATVVGRQVRAGALHAALLNGVAGHALDYDDVDQAMYGHPSAPVLPAALAAAELVGAGGAALLEAYVIGVEVACKLAYGMNPKHYQLGWHSTCTLGGIGATVAAAKLLGLDQARMHHALALGASQAGGLQQNFGTMTKPFHAGKAAQNGLLAALLAREGFTGDPAIFEAPLGFFHLFTAGQAVDGEAILAKLGPPYEIESPGLLIKKHPSCAFSHPPADAALELLADPRCAPDKIAGIIGTIHALADQILIHRQPRTGLQAKFSLEGVLALALCDGKLSLASFSDQSVLRPSVRRLMGLCQRRLGPEAWAAAGGFGPARVEVHLTSGEVLSAQVDQAKGSPENPMSRDEFAAKYRDCCAGVLAPEQVEQSLRLLARLDHLATLEELLACFRVD